MSLYGQVTRLAERIEQSMHLRRDIFRKMIVNHRIEVRPDSEDDELDQLRLRYRLTADSAVTYLQAGFTVVAQDVIIGPLLAEFISNIKHRPLYVVVLCPSTAAVAAREAARAKNGYGVWSVEQLDALLRNETPRIGMWLDSSELSSEETVNEIMSRLQDEAFYH